MREQNNGYKPPRIAPSPSAARAEIKGHNFALKEEPDLSDYHALTKEAVFLARIGELEASALCQREAFEALLESTRAAVREDNKLYGGSFVREGLGLLSARTRFFIKYADLGIHLSALVFLVAIHTELRYRQGKRGITAAWKATARWWADQIGLRDTDNVLRMMRRARAKRLLAFRRATHGMVLWVAEPRVYAELRKEKKGRYVCGWFYKKMARLLGTNESILYLYLKQVQDRDDGLITRPKIDSLDASYKFPWMTEESARKALERLYAKAGGAVARSQETCASRPGRVSFHYFWRRRTPEVRASWRKENECKQNVL
jgi:hypothetical protein